MRVLGLIPARGGSRGIPRKNLAMLAGRPLLAWTVDAAKAAPSIDRVVVSSDDKEILGLAASLEVDALARPACLAGNTARTEAAVEHALEAMDEAYDVVAVLQPTSPLRTEDDIESALGLFAGPVAAVISVVTPDKTPFKAFYENEDGFLTPVSADAEAPFRPRQSLPPAYFPNGAIYAVRAAVFLAHKSLLPPCTVPYLMGPERSLDVDGFEDLAEAEQRLLLRRVEGVDTPIVSPVEPMSNFFKVAQ